MMTVIKILGALAAGAVVITGAVILYVVIGLALGAKEDDEENGKDD